MACVFNDLAIDSKECSKLGTKGGGALARVFSASDKWDVALCDHSNAFTRTLTPSWMRAYHATPPIPAGAVWDLLPVEL